LGATKPYYIGLPVLNEVETGDLRARSGNAS
jgi:hypothetical protein